MRYFLATTSAAISCLALAACVPAPQPTPAPAPAPAPAPTPTPPPPPFDGTWMDAPLTPGDWSYAEGVARFANAFAMACDRTNRAVILKYAGNVDGSPLMTVRAETMDRTIGPGMASMTGRAGSPGPGYEIQLAANDQLLDAMAFSKGRFAIELAGYPTLYIPSYPEVTRVIEDCR
jgi:hypothetical protein